MALGRDNRPLLTRRGVMDRLSVSYPQIRRLNTSGSLKPVKTSSDGAYLFDQCDVDRIAADLKLKQRKTDNAGDIAADVWELLEKGKTRREIVITTRQPPDLVRELVREYLDAGDEIFVSAELARRCQRLLAGQLELDWSKLDETIAALLSYKAELTRAQLSA